MIAQLTTLEYVYEESLEAIGLNVDDPTGLGLRAENKYTIHNQC